MKNTIIILVIVLVLGVAGYLFIQNPFSGSDLENKDGQVEINETEPKEDQEGDEPNQTKDKTKTIIGSSINGNDIIAYHYGQGDENLLFTAGLHGGYSWNTVLMSYEVMDYLEKNPEVIPENIRVTIVPVLNPDGLEETIGKTGKFTANDVPSDSEKLIAGRFNANKVDLNRNFECDWQAEAVWQNKEVSAGTKAFSEPETQAFKSLVANINPKAVVIWYSAAAGVYTSSCHNGVLAETSDLVKVFAKASGYPAREDFDFYEITGDAVNWLAKQKIPAISVLLTNHKDIELNKNLDGIKAVFDRYAK